MDQIQLKQKIAEYFEKLPKESKEVFSSMGWMEILKNISTKYNLTPKEVETLGTETTLVLLGIISIYEYADILEEALKIEEEVKYNVLKEIDENILKGIKDQLMDVFDSNVLSLVDNIKTENKPIVFDPRFGKMPKDVQDVIARSNWKEDLYKIAQKYKLTVVQMGSLEEVTIKVISDEVKPYQYESELASKITIPKEEMSNLVNDVNEGVLIKIRNLLKKYWDEEANKKTETEVKEEIPLPPYAKTEIKIEEKPKIVEIQKSVEVVRNIEVPKQQIETPIIPIAPIKNIIFPTKKEEVEKQIEQIRPIFETPNIQKSMMEEKLKSATASDHAVSDYSVPKNNTTRPISSDPYREEI